MRKPELESALEDRCVARVDELGGAALKLRPPTGRGFPDRTIMLPAYQPGTWSDTVVRIAPRVFFVEFKRQKTGTVSRQQHAWRMLLVQLGFGVYLIDNDADFETALQKELAR